MIILLFSCGKVLMNEFIAFIAAACVPEAGQEYIMLQLMSI